MQAKTINRLALMGALAALLAGVAVLAQPQPKPHGAAETPPTDEKVCGEGCWLPFF